MPTTFNESELAKAFQRAAKTVRASGMEGCPGCVGVEVHGKPCEMNATYCCIAWFIARGPQRADRYVTGGDEGHSLERQGK